MARIPGLDWVTSLIAEEVAKKADLTHAARHAEDGADKITPVSIGTLNASPDDGGGMVMPTSNGGYQGHADDMPLGSWYISGATLANGWPVDNVHSLVTCTGHNTYAQKQQVLVEMYTMIVWVRTRHPNGAWQEWTKIGPQTLGEIGGMPVEPTHLAIGEPINDLVENGRYQQASTSDTTIVKGYPVESFAGLIEVSNYDSTMVVQRATFFDNSRPNRGMWYRTNYVLSGTGWSGWRRVVFGDDPRLLETGWRDISESWTNGWSGSLLVKRRGSKVLLYANDLISGTSDNAAVLPGGFTAEAPPGTNYSVVGAPFFSSVSSPIPLSPWLTVSAGGGNLVRMDHSYANFNGSARPALLSFETSDPWPTILPGTPA